MDFMLRCFGYLDDYARLYYKDLTSKQCLCSLTPQLEIWHWAFWLWYKLPYGVLDFDKCLVTA